MSDLEKCQKCGDEHDDLRTLWMGCFYDMNELELPFKMETIIDASNCNKPHHLYTLHVCKGCRADWMTTIKIWFDMPTRKPVSPGTGIYVRHFGANVEITEEDWHKRYPDREPVRVKQDD